MHKSFFNVQHSATYLLPLLPRLRNTDVTCIYAATSSKNVWLKDGTDYVRL